MKATSKPSENIVAVNPSIDLSVDLSVNVSITRTQSPAAHIRGF
jgi:hypothetical protein